MAVNVGILALIVLFAAHPSQAIGIPLSDFHAEAFGINIAYIKVVLYKAIPIVAVGVAAFLFYFLWSCCRCCKCCKLSTAISSSAKGVYLFILIVLLAGSSAIVFFGFSANSDQEALFNKLPVLIDEIGGFVTKVGDLATNLTTQVTNTQTAVNNLVAYDNNNNNPHCLQSSDTSNINSALSSLSSLATNVQNTANGVDFTSIQKTFNGAIDQVKSLRNIVVICVLSTLMAILVLQVVISLLNIFAKGTSKPSRNGCWRCITFFLTVFTVVIILLCFIVSAVLFVSVTAIADFCVAPTSNILTTTGLQSNNIANYFLTCNLPNPPANPFASDISNLQSQFNNIMTSLNNFNQSAKGTSCSDLSPTITDLITAVNNLHVAVGEDSNGNGAINTGLLQIIQCAGINNIYLDIVSTGCSSLGPNLVSFFIVFIALASAITLAEFFKRKLETRSVNINKVVPMTNVEMDQVAGKDYNWSSSRA